MGRVAKYWTWGIAAVALLAAPQLYAQEEQSSEGAPGDSAATEETTAPTGNNTQVSIEVVVEDENGQETGLGTISIELFKDKAPKHTANFMKLVRESFYQGTTFHRIVPAFIIQGGDPISKSDWKSPRIGTGQQGTTLVAEIGEQHLRGSVAAARKPDAVNPKRESSGSQFFICLADLPALDRGGYTVFGRVTEGMDVVDKIARVKNSGPPRNQSLQRVLMKSLKVVD